MPKSGEQFSHNQTTEVWQDRFRDENQINLLDIYQLLSKINDNLTLLNSRFEEAFETRISKEDL